MDLTKRPSFTRIHDANGVVVSPTTTIVFGRSVEERSDLAPSQLTSQTTTHFEIVEQDREAFSWIDADGGGGRVLLRSETDLSAFVSGLGSATVIDLTGLSHHIWAPLVKACLAGVDDLRCLYVEPKSYRRHPAPTEYELFDLSERIEGVAPIPGFATLGTYDDYIFAPLLGFEGRRFAYVVNEIEPRDDRIHPIIGVPGFRPEFPFHTFEGNMLALQNSAAIGQVSMSTANCPFSLYFVLDDLVRSHPGIPLAIGLIGTKPHSLGGVLFALLSGMKTEIVYDYPVRKTTRTQGVARVLEYGVSAFASWLR